MYGTSGQGEGPWCREAIVNQVYWWEIERIWTLGGTLRGDYPRMFRRRELEEKWVPIKWQHYIYELTLQRYIFVMIFSNIWGLNNELLYLSKKQYFFLIIIQFKTQYLYINIKNCCCIHNIKNFSIDNYATIFCINTNSTTIPSVYVHWGTTHFLMYLFCFLLIFKYSSFRCSKWNWKCSV